MKVGDILILKRDSLLAVGVGKFTGSKYESKFFKKGDRFKIINRIKTFDFILQIVSIDTNEDFFESDASFITIEEYREDKLNDLGI